MRQVPIRQLHKKMWLELEQLPLVITKNNTPLYVIKSYDTKEDVYTKENVDTPKESNVYTNVTTSFKLCHYPMCNEYAVQGSEYCISHK